MKEGVIEHNQIIQEFGGTIAKHDVHIAVWDVIIQPTLQVSSILPSILKPKHKQKEIMFSFVNSSDINAVAVPGKAIDHIFIFKGLIESLLGFAWVLFGTKEFLPNIGDSSKEKSIDYTGQCFEQRANLKTGVAHVAPACYDRQLISSLVASFALVLALQHEYGHIYGGHFDLLGDTSSYKGFDEISSQKDEIDVKVPLSVIEWDADCFASNLLFSLGIGMEVVDGVRKIISSTVRHPRNYSMFLWLLASHILFRSISINPAGSYGFSPLKYPSPPLRGFNFYEDAITRRRRTQGEDRNRDVEVMKIALMIEMVCSKRFGESMDDWFGIWSKQAMEIRKVYVPQRQKLEDVRRIRDTWRPIYQL
jgi:hypothetical protein